jgi:O-succinylbenzoate synthase
VPRRVRAGRARPRVMLAGRAAEPLGPVVGRLAERRGVTARVDTGHPLHVERITLREIRLPLKEPFRISSGVCTERRIFLLELRDADGVEVWAECVAASSPTTARRPSTPRGTRSPRGWRRACSARGSSIPPRCGPRSSAASAATPWPRPPVEMGCWALAAERAGMPLSRLLGGTRTHIPTASRSASSRRRAAGRARARREGRRLPQDQAQDRARLRRGVRGRRARGGGADVALMADANSAYAWPTPSTSRGSTRSASR